MVPAEHEIIYWEAFAFLSRTRRYQDGNPVPFNLNDIKSYCEFVGICDVSMRLEFAEMILALDYEWFALEREKPKVDNG